MSARRLVPALAIAALLGLPVVSMRAASERFPHALHEGLFPTCTACHAGIAGGDRAGFYTVTSEDCASCHDGDALAEVAWEPPAAPVVNYRFEHELHVEMLELECSTCHAAGKDRMDVGPARATACQECHMDGPDHLAEETGCFFCHVPLTEAGGLSAERVAAFPRPADHDEPSFLRQHGARAEANADRCATCHARDLCETCHLNAGEVALIRSLGEDARVAAAVAGRTGLWPEPESHADPDWLRVHGGLAASDPATCANCHAQSSCEPCHGILHPEGMEALPAAPAGGPSGVILEGRRPPGHVPGFAREHGAAAASREFDCMACHTQAFCEDCHRAPSRPSFHPPNYLARHDAEAYFRTTNCADCHSQETFCRDCHAQTGLASADPRTSAYHDAEPLWLLAHAEAARVSLETCATCHQETDCLPCHSQAGWGVSPHGPGFDAERLADRSPETCKVCHLGPGR